MKEKKKLVVVLGMHRSGTSVIARGLKVLGVELGDNLMSPAEDNPKGFWEDLDINTLNVEMLNFLNSDWHFLTPIQPQDVELLRSNGYLLRAVELLREKTNSIPVFGFKDPRLAKLLPLWKEVFANDQYETHYILTTRNPLSVCSSLAKRNNFEPEKGYLLWLEHVINSLTGTEGESCVLVDYDILMQSPNTELTKIAKEFNLRIDNQEIERFRLKFLDNGLRHTTYHLDDLSLDTDVPPLVREIYAKILDIARGKARIENKAFRKNVEQWKLELSRLRVAQVLADKLERKLAEHEQSRRLVELEQQVQVLSRQLAAVYASHSWQITAPVRALGAKLRWMRERGRSSATDLPVSDSPLVSIENTRVKIAAVTMVYNEALILPYFLRHYRYLDEIHVLFETDTTDESLAILLQAPNVVIEKCHIESGLDDIEKINLINQAVQSTKADWVYVVDPDEFIFPPANESPYDFLKRQTCDVVRSGMYQVYRHRNDKDLDPSLAPIPQRVHGDPDLSSTDSQANRAANVFYIKPNVVRPLKRIWFLPGHHQIEGNPQTSHELYIGAHWQMADPSIAIARRMERKARISERNRKRNMGWQHFDVSVEKIKEECERHLDDPIISELYSFKETTDQNHPQDISSDNLSENTIKI